MGQDAPVLLQAGADVGPVLAQERAHVEVERRGEGLRVHAALLLVDVAVDRRRALADAARIEAHDVEALVERAPVAGGSDLLEVVHRRAARTAEVEEERADAVARSAAARAPPSRGPGVHAGGRSRAAGPPWRTRWSRRRAWCRRGEVERRSRRTRSERRGEGRAARTRVPAAKNEDRADDDIDAPSTGRRRQSGLLNSVRHPMTERAGRPSSRWLGRLSSARAPQ